MIIRVEHRQHFTVIDNSSIDDQRLSFAAIGVLVYLLSKPDGWEVSYRQLATVRRDGEQSCRRVLRELEDAGYLERRRERDAGGHIRWVQAIHEVSTKPQVAPCGENPRMVNRRMVKPETPKTVADTKDQVAPCGDSPCRGNPGLVEPGVVNHRSKPSTERAITEQQNNRHVDVPSTEIVKRSRDAVERVFDAWKEATGKPRAALDPKRRRIIVAALRSHGETDATDAVRGWRNSPFHCGENDRNQIYNDIDLLLRDAKHIEQFRDLERNGPTGLAVSRNTRTAAEWAAATS